MVVMTTGLGMWLAVVTAGEWMVRLWLMSMTACRWVVGVWFMLTAGVWV